MGDSIHCTRGSRKSVNDFEAKKNSNEDGCRQKKTVAGNIRYNAIFFTCSCPFGTNVSGRLCLWPGPHGPRVALRSATLPPRRQGPRVLPFRWPGRDGWNFYRNKPKSTIPLIKKNETYHCLVCANFSGSPFTHKSCGIGIPLSSFSHPLREHMSSRD